MLGEKTQKKTSQEINVVVFEIGGERYGIDVMHVLEVLPIMDILPIPQAPLFVKGMINLRGKPVPIIDLREKVGMVQTEARRIIIVELDKRSIGLMVDNVLDVTRFKPSDIRQVSMVGSEKEYIKGVVDYKNKLLVLLNIEKILTAEEKVALAGIHEKISSESSKG